MELQSTPDLRKTRLCQAFEQGNCTNKDCTFAHGEEELRSTNLFYKKSLCIWNQKGKCRNGDQCRFAHGSSELRTIQGNHGGHGSSTAPPPAKQGAASEPKGAKNLREPMKVQPAGWLPASQTGQSAEEGMPSEVTLPSEAGELGHTVALDFPAPGLPYPTDAASLAAAYDSAAWWQWPMNYGMAAPALIPGAHQASIDDLKAELERIRQSVVNKDLESDLERLREDVASLTQKCSRIQMQIQAGEANPFMKAPAPGLEAADEGVGYFEAAGGNIPLPSFWA